MLAFRRSLLLVPSLGEVAPVVLANFQLDGIFKSFAKPLQSFDFITLEGEVCFGRLLSSLEQEQLVRDDL